MNCEFSRSIKHKGEGYPPALIVAILLGLFVGMCNQANAELINVSTTNACGLIADQGIKTKTGWKTYGEGMWGCNSDMINTDSNSYLANNITYYAEGTKTRVEALKLLVNINNREQANAALRKLNDLTSLLTTKATGGQKPPQTFMNAVMIGAIGKATVGKTSLELKRIDWPSGKGYDLKVTIQ